MCSSALLLLGDDLDFNMDVFLSFSLAQKNNIVQHSFALEVHLIIVFISRFSVQKKE